MTVHEIIADGDHGAIRWTCTVTHAGENLGFPATNKTVTLPGASFAVCKDGKLVEGWNFLDQTSVIHELQIAASELSAATTAAN